jgi:CHAT domain-containing protein
MYSHIVLSHPASESSEDGLLEAWEIMQMNLRADLVVLSACETALGRIGAGEGMIGLSWAFLVAGSKSLLVSQWKVESESTAQLMVSFYKNLRKGKTKAESLRLAAQALSRNPRYRHPFYWAGFVLIGES